jgi:uncharacterized DUF497 family protein
LSGTSVSGWQTLQNKLDFASAHLIFENREKITIPSPRGGEERLMDVAMDEGSGMILAFVYVQRGAAVRAISFRIASRRERKLYEQIRKEFD